MSSGSKVTRHAPKVSEFRYIKTEKHFTEKPYKIIIINILLQLAASKFAKTLKIIFFRKKVPTVCNNFKKGVNYMETLVVIH